MSKTRGVFVCSLAVLLLCSTLFFCPPSNAGSFNARRLAMGGVTLSDQGGAQSRNVAFHAVPKGGRHWSLPLPLGIVQVLADPPEIDPDDPDFNPLELAELAMNFPVFLRIRKPDTVNDDIVMDIAKNSLRIDLGSIARIVPEEPFEIGGILDQPEVGFGVNGFFAGIAPLVAGTSELKLSSSLEKALGEGTAFLPNTSYSLTEDAEIQAGIAAGLGYARRLNALPEGMNEDPRYAKELAVFAGGRFKYIVGLAYANAQSAVNFTTLDTIFGEEPLDIEFENVSVTALPEEFGVMGHGTGLDLGVVGFMGGYEVGLGVTNLATKITWKADRELQILEDSTDEVVTYTLAEDFDYTSTVPTIIVVNAAKRWGGKTIAFDIEKGVTRTMFHLGVETLVGNVALRTGTWLDADGTLQYAGGTGVRLGILGLDLALLTSTSVLTGERAVDLALSISL